MSSKVAIGKAENKHASDPQSKSQRGGLGLLEPIFGSPPLLEAFDIFCQKALCGEVRFPTNNALRAEAKRLTSSSGHHRR